jgi:predicted GNAT family acetyltransferase
MTGEPCEIQPSCRISEWKIDASSICIGKDVPWRRRNILNWMSTMPTHGADERTMDRMAGADAPRRFELMREDACVGFIEYSVYGRVAIVTHTEIARRHEGQGLGSQLARQALQFFGEQGWQVVPVCAFFARYLRTHPEYSGAVTPASRRIFDL